MRWIRLAIVLVSTSLQASQSSLYELRYHVRLKVPPGKNQVRVWLPYPAERRVQTVRKVEIQSPLNWKKNEEERFGNQILYFEGNAFQSDLEINVQYEIARWGQGAEKPVEPTPASIHRPEKFLGEDKNVPLIPLFKKIATKETTPTMSDETKIRALYDFVVSSMRYDKSGVGWGNGDAVWACLNKRGNCTDFHSLFIGLSRSVKVPARFLIGLPIPKDLESGEISGYHCWAEAYSKERGWIPIDASEAKKHDAKDAYFGQLPPDRIEFTMGRDIALVPKSKGGPLNYFIHPYAEVNGKAHDLVSKSYSFKRLPDPQTNQTL